MSRRRVCVGGHLEIYFRRWPHAHLSKNRNDYRRGEFKDFMSVFFSTTTPNLLDLLVEQLVSRVTNRCCEMVPQSAEFFNVDVTILSRRFSSTFSK